MAVQVPTFLSGKIHPLGISFCMDGAEWLLQNSHYSARLSTRFPEVRELLDAVSGKNLEIVVAGNPVWGPECVHVDVYYASPIDKVFEVLNVPISNDTFTVRFNKMSLANVYNDELRDLYIQVSCENGIITKKASGGHDYTKDVRIFSDINGTSQNKVKDLDPSEYQVTLNSGESALKLFCNARAQEGGGGSLANCQALLLDYKHSTGVHIGTSDADVKIMYAPTHAAPSCVGTLSFEVLK